MVKLVERALIKDLMSIPRADTAMDSIMNGMIEQASAEVERIVRREFEKKARTEFYKSYEQGQLDPDPLYIWLRSFPVDPAAVGPTIVWDAFDLHDTSGTTLDESQNDFAVKL